MSYDELRPETRAIAERVLNDRQLLAFKLWLQGVSSSRIAVMLDVSEPRARQLVVRAQQKVIIERGGK